MDEPDAKIVGKMSKTTIKEGSFGSKGITLESDEPPQFWWRVKK